MGKPRLSHSLNHGLCFLVNGSLTIEVDIKGYKYEAPAWRPKKTLHLDMKKILESAKQPGDVKFHVGSEEVPAHRYILEARAIELAAIAKDYPSDSHSHPRHQAIHIQIAALVCVCR
jgi:hypothetical protein